jgi:hypothetical protein
VGGQCARCLVELALTPEEHAPESGFPADAFGSYVLERRLGAGGMGVVYVGRHLQSGEHFALKLMRDSLGASPALLRRFAIEAEAAARLNHPHIVRIHEVGEFQGQPFVSMDLIRGESLDARLARGDFGLDADDAPARQIAMARLVLNLARAVQHAHERSVLHRDLKPGNILIDAAGEPHLTDFGLAKILSRETAGEDSPALTRTGEAPGTPSYMSPEQVAGSEPTEASDIYGLGGVLYALLTGRPPFRGGTALTVFRQIAHQPPVPPRSLNARVHAELETICLKCLEKEPRRRYRSAGAVADDLLAFLERRPIRARRAGRLYRTRQWIQHNPLGAALIATLCVGLCAALVLLKVVNDQRREIELDRDQTFDEGMQKISQLWREAATRSVTISARELAILDGRPLRELQGAQHSLTLGVNADEGPSSMAQRYARWLGAWQDAIAGGAGRRVIFHLRIFKRFEQNAEALQRGEVELLVMNAAEFILENTRRPQLEALAQARGSREGVLFGRVEAGVNSLADLKGKKLALPDPTSTLSIWAKARLVAGGWRVGDFDACTELADQPGEAGAVSVSTAATLDRVLQGDADAGVTYRAPFERHRHLGLVLLDRFIETPNVLVIRTNLPTELKTALRYGLQPRGHSGSRPEAPFVVPTSGQGGSGFEDALKALQGAMTEAARFGR